MKGTVCGVVRYAARAGSKDGSSKAAAISIESSPEGPPTQPNPSAPLRWKGKRPYEWTGSDSDDDEDPPAARNFNPVFGTAPREHEQQMPDTEVALRQGQCQDRSIFYAT